MTSASSNHIEIGKLSEDTVPEAAQLLLKYKGADGSDEAQKRECELSLRRLLDVEHSELLAAQIGGRLAGFVSISWGYSITKGKPVLRIQDLFTDPGFRGRGIAAALLRHCEAAARRRGASRLQLETDADNEAARSLYGKMGFEHIEGKIVYMKPLHLLPEQ